jgi:hypothetical protein
MTPMADSKLLPCPNPWCNSRNQSDEEIRKAERPIVVPGKEGRIWAVACPVCPVQTPWLSTPEEAVVAWNTRPTAPALDGLREAIDELREAYAALDVSPDEEWYAYIHKGGYDLCVESARRQPDHPNAATDAIIGRFACGQYAIRALPVIAKAMNLLPALLPLPTSDNSFSQGTSDE